VGVNYHVPPGADPLAVRLLAQAGVRALRIEVGFGRLAWEEDRLADEPRLRVLLALCRRHGLRPTFLLNAHQGVPCPLRSFQRTLAADAPAGSRMVRLTDTAGLDPGRTGLSHLSNDWAAEV
jgi:hypothetical protein